MTDRRVCQLSDALRKKPEWWIKKNNETIRAKWKFEALEQEILGGKLTAAEVDYVLDELEGYNQLRDSGSGAEVRPTNTLNREKDFKDLTSTSSVSAGTGCLS